MVQNAFRETESAYTIDNLLEAKDPIDAVDNAYSYRLSEQRRYAIIQKMKKMRTPNEKKRYAQSLGMSTRYDQMTDSGKFAMDLIDAGI